MSTKVLIDVLDFSLPGINERLNKKFGKAATTWEEVKEWDDCVINKEKLIIEDLRENNSGICPQLKTKGKYFNFCATRAKEYEAHGYKKGNTPSSSDAQYLSKVNLFEIQIYCMAGKEEFSKCGNISNSK